MKSVINTLIKFWINVSLRYFWHSQIHRIDHQEISRFWDNNCNDPFLLKRIQVNESKLWLIDNLTSIRAKFLLLFDIRDDYEWSIGICEIGTFDRKMLSSARFFNTFRVLRSVILHAMKFENLEMDKKMIKEESVDLSRFD